MTKHDLREEYFQWILEFIYDTNYTKVSYLKLLRHLFNKEFTYIFEMDGNRADDGIELRYRFGSEKGYDQREIATLLDQEPCSILEMMAALSIRCETHLMADSDYGDRTGQWFWNMINNLGLGHMTDNNFDPVFVNDILDRFLTRRFSKNGAGSLFKTSDENVDMRDLEIWYQMQEYMNDIFYEERG